MAELLGLNATSPDLLLSEKYPSDKIRTWLRGDNSRIKNNAEFKKSTPPGRGSRIIDITDNNWFINNYTRPISKNLHLATVGSYSENGLASSCYHNNLAILENILSHTNDSGVVAVDMVAGTDTFASTLYAQFDMLVFAVEPTVRGLKVLDDYLRLAEAGGVADRVVVVANKVDDKDDEEFVRKYAGKRFMGSIYRSQHLHNVDKGRESLDFDKLENISKDVFVELSRRLESIAIPAQDRLPKLWEIHKIYIGQDYVKKRFGDLTDQIDDEFKYDDAK